MNFGVKSSGLDKFRVFFLKTDDDVYQSGGVTATHASDAVLSWGFLILKGLEKGRFMRTVELSLVFLIITITDGGKHVVPFFNSATYSLDLMEYSTNISSFVRGNLYNSWKRNFLGNHFTGNFNNNPLISWVKFRNIFLSEFKYSSWLYCLFEVNKGFCWSFLTFLSSVLFEQYVGAFVRFC